MDLLAVKVVLKTTSKFQSKHVLTGLIIIKSKLQKMAYLQ